jgi:integrase
MPRRSTGPHLWLRKERRTKGKLLSRATWLIIDNGRHIATGCDAGQAREAQGRLAEYIADKYRADRRLRDIEEIDIADVLALYDEDCRERQANKAKFDERMMRLTKWWGGKMMSEVTGATCRAYAKSRGGPGGARRDLEDLRAAINHHAKEGLHRGEVRVVLPAKGTPRERWLTRSEAAKLLWTCWRHREVQTVHRGPSTGQKITTGKYPLRHLARFILIGLYTGTRAAAIASASPRREEGRSFVDLDAGIFYRLAQGRRATNKRQPPVPLPRPLLAHMRRWERLGIANQHFVEWHGKPVASVKTAFRTAVHLAGLSTEEGNVTPHTLRHTAATWLMQNGAPMWDAAGFLGMSEKTLRDVYGHHHPDHLRLAAAAIARPRQSLVISLEKEKTVPAQPMQIVDIIGGPGRIRTSNQTVMSGRL